MMVPGYDPSYMTWMMIGTGLFWLVLVALAVFAIARLTPGPRNGDASAILRERLARGEITPEEFQARRVLVSGK